MIFRTAVIFAIIGTLGAFAYVRMTEKTAGPDPRVALAECLTEKGVKMYGAYWCPHCQKQKKLFGKAFEKVTYVECAVPGDPRSQTQACKDADIQSYPTWVFPDDKRVTGEQSLTQLAERADCPYEPPA